jgi:hypothetical protein
MENKGQKVVNIAFKEVGTKESPTNSNKTKYGKWFGFDGVAWCAIFVSWCYSQAGFPLPNIGYKKGMAGCQTAVNHFKESKEIIFMENLKVGDLIFFDWNKDGRFDHVAMFNGWRDKDMGEAYTIEGNTSLTNQSNGGEVMNRKRNLHAIKCIFVHPKVLD